MTELTTTERAAHAMEMDEHREKKCARCAERLDLHGGGYICARGLDPGRVLRSKRPECGRFRLQEDKSAWL